VIPILARIRKRRDGEWGCDWNLPEAVTQSAKGENARVSKGPTGSDQIFSGTIGLVLVET
jgi:hypothetical protein